MVLMSEPATPSYGAIPEWTLGWRLKRALDFADLSAQDMAAELGVHVGTISRWMNDRETPRRAYMMAWALRTGVPFGWISGVETVRPVASGDWGPPLLTDPDIPSGMSVDHDQPPTQAEILAYRKAFRLRYSDDAKIMRTAAR